MNNGAVGARVSRKTVPAPPTLPPCLTRCLRRAFYIGNSPCTGSGLTESPSTPSWTSRYNRWIGRCGSQSHCFHLRYAACPSTNKTVNAPAPCASGQTFPLPEFIAFIRAVLFPAFQGTADYHRLLRRVGHLHPAPDPWVGLRRVAVIKPWNVIVRTGQNVVGRDPRGVQQERD